MNFKLSCFFALVFYSLVTSAESNKNLYSLDPISKSKNDAIIPISQSIEEWEIVVEKGLLNESVDQLELTLPHDSKTFFVQRESFRRYESGNTQWAGKIKLKRKYASSFQSGYVIINIINGSPYGIIKIDDVHYEIYSDANVGTRLARVTSHSGLEYDTSNHKESSHHPSIKENKSGLPTSVSEIQGTSIIDVLVVIDTDLTTIPNTPIYNRITAEEMNAELILSNSGPNGTGVPIRLNLLPFQFVDIPSQYEDITYTNGAFSAYNHLANETSTESNMLKQMLINSGADFLALYIPFDPEPDPTPGTFADTQACGIATVPQYAFQDLRFSSSFSMHASNCTISQFVFLHELMHGFGIVHLPEDTGAFEDYARGFNVLNSSAGDFSTVMGCSGFESGNDPSETTCNRIPQLSSPLVNVNGEFIGNDASTPSSNLNADNVRFLTECELNGPCRRGQLANKGTGNSPPVDFLPSADILSPVDGEIIAEDDALNIPLTATVSDDIGISSVTWTITDITNNPSSVVDMISISSSGGNSNFNTYTSAMATPGQYIISLTAFDTISQSTVDTHLVTVESSIAKKLPPILRVIF